MSRNSIPCIAVDATGGDLGSQVIVAGAVQAARELKGAAEVVLFGDEHTMRVELSKLGTDGLPLRLIHAPEVIGMGEGAVAFRKKRNSSIAVATKLQKEGKADAFVSAGNTGVVVAASLLGLGRLSGVDRPAIATVVPNEFGGCVMLDVGANSDCKPVNLVQFGIMGSIYARNFLERPEPKVGLLNIGEEGTKGSDLAVEAHKLLSESPLKFIGNVEGRDVFRGRADVVVCDGFTGNILLKFMESVIHLLAASIREEVDSAFRNKVGALLMKPAFKRLERMLDYAEYGGAPLLGVDGVCIICHGSSSAKAVKNAVKAAVRFVETRVNDIIRDELTLYTGGKVEAH
ncbi:MAG: phosphate acyltransferase PlsX [Candidatus Eisenbacteria bacterium]|nr:phosphate acyltransferase PlsX [Candidatus Eisenbacteria bacterium]